MWFLDAVDAIEAYINDPDQFDSLFQNNHRNTDEEFNKLRENDDHDTTHEDVEEKSPSPALVSPPSTKKTANKRKSVSFIVIFYMKIFQKIVFLMPGDK